MRLDTRHQIGRFGLSTIVGMLAAGMIFALSPASRAANPASPLPPPDYHPSMGDLMTMSVQPRHIKLGLAGKARNWDYAAYEVSELKNAFGRVIKLNPTYRKTDLAAMYASNMKDPMDKLEAAIKAKNAKAFNVAYATVTHSCNTCHQGLEHSFVVIKMPTASPFADQSFARRARTKAK